MKNTRIDRSFTMSSGNLIFQITNNILTVFDKNGNRMSTPTSSDEMQSLSEFCIKSKDILCPFPGNEIVYTNDSGYQNLILFKDERNNYTLVINDQVQFITHSEEIYHEALVGPAVCSLDRIPKKFLILGGGDGLVAKQIYKENPEAEVLLVDFDRNMLELFKNDSVMIEFNENSLNKCQLFCEDAFEFSKNIEGLYTKKFDIIICDFPDPDDEILNKLYSLEFYSNVKKLLADKGCLAVQSGSLVKNSISFKCIAKTVEKSGFNIKTFYTPSSYGELVYTIAMEDKIPVPDFSKSKRKYETLSQEYFDKAMSNFRPGTCSEEEVDVNTVENFKAYDDRTYEIKRQK